MGLRVHILSLTVSKVVLTTSDYVSGHLTQVLYKRSLYSRHWKAPPHPHPDSPSTPGTLIQTMAALSGWSGGCPIQGERGAPTIIQLQQPSLPKADNCPSRLSWTECLCPPRFIALMPCPQGGVSRDGDFAAGMGLGETLGKRLSWSDQCSCYKKTPEDLLSPSLPDHTQRPCEHTAKWQSPTSPEETAHSETDLMAPWSSTSE